MLSYRKEIDGLRAFAVLPVLFFHAGFSVFSGGYVGVDIFFVISGFLISSIIIKELKEQKFSLAHFYERRARRILPALFFVMACCIPFSIMFMWPDELRRFFSSIVATSVFSSNILFYLQSGYFETGAELKPLLHTWSLAVEEQFYIIFPVFMIITWRLGIRKITALIAMVFIGSLLISEWASHTHSQANFYLPITRAWELLMGTLLALYIDRKGLPKKTIGTEIFASIGFIAILGAILGFDKGTPFPGFYALIPVLGTGLILLYAQEGTIIANLLRFRVFVWTGLISYSAYLWHHPIFAFARLKSLNEPTAQLYAVLIILSLILAYISWRFIEKPFRQKNNFTQKQIFTFSLLGMLFFISFGLVGYFTPIFEKNLTNIQKNIYMVKENKTSFYTMDGTDCADKANCVLGKKSGKPSILLIGDSHAGHLIYNLDGLLSKKDMTAKAMTDADIYMDNFPAFYPNHEKFNKALEKRKELIFSNDIDTVILSGRYTLRILRSEFDNKEGGIEKLQTATDYHGYSHEQQEEVKKHIKQGIEDILSKGKKVILVYPIPEVGWVVPDTYLKLYKTMPHDKFNEEFQSLLTTDYQVYKNRNKHTIDLFNSIKHPNLKRIYPDKLFCDTKIKDRCITASDGNVYYVDDDHLSVAGSKLITDEIDKFLTKKE